MKVLRRIWELMALGHRRKFYIDLFSQGIISREEMLEKTK